MWQSWRCEPMECWHCMFPSCIRYASICVYIVLCAVLPTDIRHIHVCLLIRCRVHMAYGIRRNTANRRIAAYSRHILHVCCVCIQNVALHIARRCACSFAAILSSCFRLMAILVVFLLCVWPTRLMTSQQFFFLIVLLSSIDCAANLIGWCAIWMIVLCIWCLYCELTCGRWFLIHRICRFGVLLRIDIVLFCFKASAGNINISSISLFYKIFVIWLLLY